METRQKNKRGKRIRWCPIDGYHTLTSSIRPHLRRVHKITNSPSLNELFRRSLFYERNKLPVSVALLVPVPGYDVPRHGQSVPDVGHCGGDTIEQLRELQQVFESVEGLMLFARMA